MKSLMKMKMKNFGAVNLWEKEFDEMKIMLDLKEE